MAAAAALILPESPSMKKAVSLINAIDIGRFPRLLTRILQKLHLKAENSFSEEEEEKLQAAFSLEKQDLRLVLEIISFILEQAVYHTVKPAALQQQLEALHLRPDKAEAFGNAWSSMGQETVEKFRQRILAPHKRERHSERGNTSRGSGRGRSRPPVEQGARCGARSQDPGIMT
ncbi:COMM domain-containing protein 10 isoform X2 [Callorhinus ursinus]|uniref:COMM domain-containing protein 10 isoform X2 n=1 Tax=Zalophus californianus TaxID=9704 RepID=A0A6J2E1Q2_ZALCA|nr:COMM domain-containing protein 10 isoform X2 [Zalophus californianus]